MSRKWTYEIGLGYESILRDGVMVNKEQAVRALKNYESRITELEHDLTNKEIEYTDLWDDALAFQSRIAELEAEVEALKAECRWTPVSERLPELDQDVLAIVEGNIVTGHFYQQWDGEIYFSSDDEGAMMVATHWMPLPKLPEVQE